MQIKINRRKKKTVHREFDIVIINSCVESEKGRKKSGGKKAGNTIYTCKEWVEGGKTKDIIWTRIKKKRTEICVYNPGR